MDGVARPQTPNLNPSGTTGVFGLDLGSVWSQALGSDLNRSNLEVS